MEITNSLTSPTTSKAANTLTGKSNALASDFETFLKMLTAQARYQDPLEPIDSSEYAAQLAQFSMVEQQVLSNDLLTTLNDRLGGNSIGEMATWIGMEARSTSASAFNGGTITVMPAVDPGAEEAVLVAYASDGTEVDRRQIDTKAGIIEWDGILRDGGTAPIGNYSFKVESRQLGQVIATTPAETYSRISEARRQGGETVFVLDSGATLLSSEVSALREGKA